MTTTDSSPAPRVPETPALAVSVAVLFVDGDCLEDTLSALERQSYAVDTTTIVGGGDVGEAAAARGEFSHVRSFSDFVNNLSSDVDVAWVVHGDALPRPDALAALVVEMERNDASLLGSKILSAEDPSQLESVGAATDVFGEPYAGLDPGEVDLEQYDVVRDVAFIAGVSMLIRRDLLKGLRGIDIKLPPVAAGMDLSQRARIAGGRVMVAPSSEVLHARRCGHEVAGWRELAGRMRSTLKAYRWITLAWVIPVATVVALIDGLVRLMVGQPAALWDLVRAAGWNIVQLPSTMRARAGLRSVRQVRDEELFRYQVSGSIRLRNLGTLIGEKLGWAIDTEPGIEEEEVIGAEVRRTGPVVATLVMVLVALAARHLWFGNAPAVGFTLPGATDPGAVLDAYSGGWNPAGLGGAGALHPATAILAGFSLIFGSGAQAVLAIVTMTLGVFGMARLLRRVGIDGASRYLAGPVLLLGPFAATVTDATHWAGLMAAGGVPWLVDLGITRWPGSWRGRLGRLALMALISAVTVTFAPAAAVIPVVAVVIGATVVTECRRWSLVRSVLVAAFGVLAVGSYLWNVEPDILFGGVPGYDIWEAPLRLGLVGVAAVAAILAAPSPRWRVAAWGGMLASTGVGLPLVPGAGGEIELAAILLGGLGAGLAVGAALPVDTSTKSSTVIGAIGSLAAVAVVFATGTHLLSGDAGLGSDEWGRRLEFVEALSDEVSERVLLIGLPGSLPGEHRDGSAYSYRVVNGSMPTLDQAWLPEPGEAENELADTLAAIDRADVVRPGSMLRPFAIGWVVVLDEVQFLDALRAQIDLTGVPLEPGVSVFRNTAAGEVASPIDAERTPDPVSRRLAWLTAALTALAVPLAVWGRERS